MNAFQSLPTKSSASATSCDCEPAASAFPSSWIACSNARLSRSQQSAALSARWSAYERRYITPVECSLMVLPTRDIARGLDVEAGTLENRLFEFAFEDCL